MKDFVGRGRHECKEVDVSLPWEDRLVAEVEAYKSEYKAPASLADIVTEINTRCKKLAFQGALAAYATRDEKKVARTLDTLVRQGRIRRSRDGGYVPKP